jgi:hypothetical protein
MNTPLAGRWGAYGCDVPTETVVEMMKYINKTMADEYDYLMLNGDFCHTISSILLVMNSIISLVGSLLWSKNICLMENPFYP